MKYAFSLIIFLILNPITLWSQESKYVTSSNSKFFGYYTKISKKESNLPPNTLTKSNTYEFRYYDVSTKKIILTYQFYAKNTNSITITISHDGKTVAINTDNFATYVINAITGYVIKTIYHKDVTIVFPYFDHCFYLYDYKHKNILRYDTYTGKLLNIYNSTGYNTGYGKFFITQNDKYIIQQKSKTKLYVWHTNKENRLKSVSATDYKMDFYNNHITFVKGLKVSTYDLNTFKLILQSDLKNLKRNLLKQKSKNNLKIEIGTPLLSNSGNFFIIPYSSNGKNSLMLSSTQRDENKDIPIANLDDIHDIAWLNDSILILNHENNTTSLLNLYHYNDVTTLDYGLTKRKYKANKNIDVALNLDYYVQNKTKLIDNKIEVNNSRNQKTLTIDDVKFICFTTNGKAIIAKNVKTNVYGVINLSSVNSVKFIPFEDSNNTKKEVLNVDTEEVPTDYNPHQIKQFKHISELKDSTAMINLILNNVVFTDSTISINTHLIDEDGTYYYGAGSEEWKHIWCNLLLQHSNNQITQITDFEIIEHYNLKSKEYATSIVMDHSGSMGEKRALRLQSAVVKYINKKEKNEAIALIKFDNKTGIESYLSTNEKHLIQNFKQDGLKNYGGGTSILDAINAGISIVNNADDSTKKSIIILTDGMENSSFIEKDEVIKRAIDNNISVFIIGYGKDVDEDYLKSVSEATNGKYYKIYRQSDFDWIYNDIELKMKNYYEIKFKSSQKGDYNSILKICIGNNQTDTLSIQFSNTKNEGVKTIDQQIKDSLQYNYELISLSSHPDITNFDRIKTNSNTQKLKEDSIQIEIENQFDSLTLPDIKFESNTTDIIQTSLNGIDDVYNFLIKYPSIKIEISGHTDSDGNEEMNMILSKNRAIKVKDILIKKGISPERISTKGYGELFPILENNTEENKQINRRVEFKIK